MLSCCGNDADALARRARLVAVPVAHQLDRAAVGIDEAEAEPQRRRLAGAVRPEQAEALAARDREVRAGDDLGVAVALAQPSRDTQDLGRGSALSTGA